MVGRASDRTKTDYPKSILVKGYIANLIYNYLIIC